MMPRVPGAARARSVALQTRDRTMCGGPGLAVYRIRDE